MFLVRGAGRELEEPEARDDLLRAVATATGGSFRGPGESLDGLQLWPPRVVRVNAAPRRRAVEPLVDAGGRRRLPERSTGRCAVAGATRSGFARFGNTGMTPLVLAYNVVDFAGAEPWGTSQRSAASRSISESSRSVARQQLRRTFVYLLLLA